MNRVAKLAAGLALGWLTLAGCAHRPGPLEGAWLMVEYGGQPVVDRSLDGLHGRPAVKILTDDHFAFGHQTADGQAWAGGGRYVYEDGLYTEIIEYHSLPEMVGLTIAFRCRLEDDLWYHRAEFDHEGRHFVIDEVWRRIGNGEAETGSIDLERDGADDILARLGP